MGNNVLDSRTLRIFCWLLWRDAMLVTRDLPSRIFDSMLWSGNNIIISSFILTAFGATSSFGVFTWIGSVMTMSIFESAYSAHELVNDVSGDNHTRYLLTLPIPSWMIFTKCALGYALNAMALSIFMVPLGKLILLDKLDLSNMNIPLFILFFVLSNVFLGFFAIWIASWASARGRFSTVWRRLINPIWLWGGFQFSWLMLHEAFPRLSYITLLNPITYAFEGMRATILGSSQFLPLWVSFAAMIVLTFLFGIWGIKWMKQRLDYVGY